MTEKWPFLDEASGAKIYPAMFYGFGDSGFIAGSFEGYLSREDAIEAVADGADDTSWISTNPKDLGASAITVLSGLEFVDRLKSLGDGELEIHGKWSD